MPLFSPWNTGDQSLFVLNHPSDHNLYATGIKGIFKSFHVHFCGPQIYIPMKIPYTTQLKEAFCQMYHVLVQLMMGKTACSMFRVLRHLVTDVFQLLTVLRRRRSNLSSNSAGLRKQKKTTKGRWCLKTKVTVHTPYGLLPPIGGCMKFMFLPTAQSIAPLLIFCHEEYKCSLPL